MSKENMHGGKKANFVAAEIGKERISSMQLAQMVTPFLFSKMPKSRPPEKRIRMSGTMN